MAALEPVERANDYYRLFINWTNEKMKTTFAERNAFGA